MINGQEDQKKSGQIRSTKVNEYKYIEEQVKIREDYKSNIISLEEGIDKLIAIGYSYEEAEEFLTKEIEEMSLIKERNKHGGN